MSSDSLKTVRDFVSLVRGTTYKGDLVGKPGPALLGLGAIQPGGGFREADFKTYGGDCPAKLMLSPGDLFVSLKGATKDGKMIGSVARVPDSVASGRLTQDTVKLQFFQPNKKTESYLYWVLRSPQYREYCAGRAMGSAVVAMSREDFLSYEVPPFTRYRSELVELFEDIEKRERLLREANATLEAIAQALFKSWFVDFDPVRAKMEGRSPEGMDDATAALFPDSFEESELGLVPKGWRVGSVEDLCSTITNGGTPSRSKTELWEGGTIPWFKTGEFNDGFLLQSSERITLKALEASAAKLLPENSVLMAIYAAPTVGRLGVLTEPSTFNQACTGMVAKANVGTWFLFWTLYFGRDWFNSRANGAAQQNISKAIVSAYRVVIPSDPVLLAANEVTASVHNRIRGNSEQAQALATLRDTLLPRLISGQFRLPEVA